MSFATIARENIMGETKVLHRFEKYRMDAEASVRTPDSAFAFDEHGNIRWSCHVPFPPAELYHGPRR